MATKTGITWTDSTLNAATGCTEVSAGCDHCYARVLAERLQAMGQVRYANGFTYTEHPDVIDQLRRWREPRRVFVNSMSDVFHEDATKPFVFRLFETMVEVDRHTYQVLTKRPGKMASWTREFCKVHGLDVLPWHIWCGASTENQAAADLRIPQLLRVPAQVRFLSCEPLIGPVDLTEWLIPCPPNFGVTGSRSPLYPIRIHWVITGGESGPGYRPMDAAWARSLRDQCAAAGVPMFHKQDSGLKPGQRPELDGRLHHEFPERPVTRQAVLL
jgi:protein gp37